MPKKYRKMLIYVQVPYIQSIMRLIETQSKPTIVNWCVDYADMRLASIYETSYPDDNRPKLAIAAARRWLDGDIKLPQAKAVILGCHAAARESEGSPAAQAAARAIGHCASTIHAPTHSAGLMLYGALAVAYDKLGSDAEWEYLLAIAEEECEHMEKALRAVMVENEPNPAKINWKC